MLKFFRKYNRIILVIGVVILMAAFGIGPAIRSFMPGPGERPLGTVYGQELVFNDRRGAERELQVVQSLISSRFGRQLGQMSQLQQSTFRALMEMQLQRMLQSPDVSLPEPTLPVPFELARGTDSRADAGLAWLLALRHARQLGIGVSDGEVNQALAELGIGTDRIDQAVDRLQIVPNEAALRQTIRHWLMLEQYATVVAGRAFSNMSVNSANPGLRKLELLASLGQGQNRQQQMQNLMDTAGFLASAQRVSAPLVKHYFQQQRARVGGRLLPLSASERLARVDTPDEPRLRELFNEYKDDLPGTGEPWAIGYKYPDRVKLEALVLPIERVQATVDVEPAEVLDYYENNKSQYTVDSADTQPAGTQGADQTQETRYKPVNEVYPQIEQTLKQQKAQDKARQILETAANLLEEPLRSVPESGGYKQIPSDFSQFLSRIEEERPEAAKQLEFEAVVAELQRRFGVKAEIRRFQQQWHPVTELSELPGIGSARLPNQQQGSLTAYVQTARTFDPPADNPLAGLRLQVGMPSEQLSTQDSRLLIRLSAAQANHEPASLASVRSRVLEHATEIAAYNRLMEQRELLLDQAKQQGLENVATSEGGEVRAFQPVPRRQQAGFGSGEQPPQLPGVGRSDVLIDRIFEFASRLAGEDQPIAARPQAERTEAVGLKAQRTLVLYEVDTYQPASGQGYRQQWQSAGLPALTSQWAVADAQLTDPLSLQAIQDRTGFTRAEAADDGPDEPDAEQSDGGTGTAEAAP